MLEESPVQKAKQTPIGKHTGLKNMFQQYMLGGNSIRKYRNKNTKYQTKFKDDSHVYKTQTATIFWASTANTETEQ